MQAFYLVFIRVLNLIRHTEYLRWTAKIEYSKFESLFFQTKPNFFHNKTKMFVCKHISALLKQTISFFLKLCVKQTHTFLCIYK